MLFDLERYVEAVASFRQAMSWGVGGDAVSTSVKQQKKNPCPCSVKYWYAHALAGLEGFMEDPALVAEAVDVLQFVVQRCKKDPSVSGEMTGLAQKQAKKLTESLLALQEVLSV